MRPCAPRERQRERRGGTRAACLPPTRPVAIAGASSRSWPGPPLLSRGLDLFLQCARWHGMVDGGRGAAACPRPGRACRLLSPCCSAPSLATSHLCWARPPSRPCPPDKLWAISLERSVCCCCCCRRCRLLLRLVVYGGLGHDPLLILGLLGGVPPQVAICAPAHAHAHERLSLVARDKAASSRGRATGALSWWYRHPS